MPDPAPSPLRLALALKTAEQAELPLHLAGASPAAAYLAGLGPSSAATMRQALGVLSTLLSHPDPLTCPWHRLTYAHTAALRARLAEAYAPATANKLLAALRGVLRSARRLGLMSADAAAAASDVPPVRGASVLRGRALETAELAALLRACAADASARGRRDAALLGVAYAGGLRRAELVALDVGDLADDGRLLVRRGKGAKDRALYLAGGALQLLRAWLRLRPAGAIFVAISKAGRLLDDRRLTPAAVRSILLARCAQAGVAPATPHDLRRTFVSTLLDRSVDLATVARAAGHASVATTQRYDRRGDRALQAAAAAIGDLPAL